jgi:hypothetical protein
VGQIVELQFVPSFLNHRQGAKTADIRPILNRLQNQAHVTTTTTRNVPKVVTHKAEPKSCKIFQVYGSGTIDLPERVLNWSVWWKITPYVKFRDQSLYPSPFFRI